MPSPLKAVKCRADLSGYLRRYKQQPELTPRLDGLGQTKFTQATINEIVLWKVNRYAFLTPAILSVWKRYGGSSAVNIEGQNPC